MIDEEAARKERHQSIRQIATRWSLVKRYRDGDARISEIAADEIARIYLVPLYAWLRGKGLAHADAQDTLQDFMARMFGDGALKRADAGRGRLRGFLLTSLKNSMNSGFRAENTLRRGGRAAHFPIDWLTVEEISRCAIAEPSPEAAYDRGWAGVLMEVALARVESSYVGSGQIEIFRRLLPVLEDDLPPGGYERIGAELELSPAALRVAAFRLRKRFATEVRQAASLAFELPDGPELEEELRGIFQA